MISRRLFTTHSPIGWRNSVIRPTRRFLVTTSNEHKRVNTASSKESTLRWRKAAQSAARIGTTTWHLGLVALGTVVFGTVTYALYRELYASDTIGELYNQAWSLIKADDTLKQMLGEPVQLIKASRISVRARYIVSDANQREHTLIRIPIQGSVTTGEAHVDAIKIRNDKQAIVWQVQSIYVDIPGHGLPSKRITVVEPSSSSNQLSSNSNLLQRVMKRSS
ncbi:hypothetical protein BDF22DRAFT_700031 [Syncephalis plumigaleata]|nr:hypothetical protein BDF22DRAFT_700031 [Syncephalis plumigaleata]